MLTICKQGFLSLVVKAVILPLCSCQVILSLFVYLSGLFILIGLIVYGASYSNSEHLSSAYGLTFCAFFGSVLAGALFLWDKIELDKEIREKDARRAAAPSRARSHRSQAFSQRSRRSHARSQLSQSQSQRSAAQSTTLGSKVGGQQSQKTQSTTA